MTLRTAYYTGTREEALMDFWATHRKRDVIASSVQVRQAHPRANGRCWYIAYRPTRALMRRAGVRAR